MPSKPLSAFKKYLLFQLPGIGLTIVVLAAITQIWDLPISAAILLFALWVAKDLALYPFLKVAYEPSGSSRNGPDAVLGNTGIAQEDLDPEGYVKIGSELWRACAENESAVIASGAPIRVIRMHNLTVVVEATHGDDT